MATLDRWPSARGRSKYIFLVIVQKCFGTFNKWKDEIIKTSRPTDGKPNHKIIPYVHIIPNLWDSSIDYQSKSVSWNDPQIRADHWSIYQSDAIPTSRYDLFLAHVHTSVSMQPITGIHVLSQTGFQSHE